MSHVKAKETGIAYNILERRMNELNEAQADKNVPGEATSDQSDAVDRNKSKNKASLALLWYSDVFASAVNVLLCDGTQTVDPADLQDTKTFSAFGFGEKLKEQARDVAKLWVSRGMKIAFLGIEHQSAPDPRMVLRVMGYDLMAYLDQNDDDEDNSQDQAEGSLQEEEEQDYRYPVLTVVLNFNLKRWGSPRTLQEYLDKTPDKIKQACGPLWKLLANYGPIQVIDMAWLSDEQIDLLHPDLRGVALALRGKRLYGKAILSEDSLVHFLETARLMSVLSGQTKEEREEYLRRVSEKAARKNNRGITMLDLFADFEAQGYEKARVDMDALRSDLAAANQRADGLQQANNDLQQANDDLQQANDDLQQKLDWYITRYGDKPQ